MLRKTGLIAALAIAAVATPLHAEEHYVVLLDTGYFPDVVYPEIGDTIRFYNQGELPMAATATDESWSSGILMPGEDFVLTVVDGIKQTYDNAVPAGADASTVGAVVAAVGVIDYFNDAPVDLGADGKPLLLADHEYDD